MSTQRIYGERWDNRGHHWVVTDPKKIAYCTNCRLETGSESADTRCKGSSTQQSWKGRKNR